MPESTPPMNGQPHEPDLQSPVTEPTRSETTIGAPSPTDRPSPEPASAEPVVPQPEAAAAQAEPPPPPERPRRRPRRRWQVGTLLKSAGVRAYALALLAVIAVAGYWAFDYLVRLVFNPPGAPKALVEWRGSLQADALRVEHVPGVTGPAARAPLAHYHRIEQWYQPDPYNGCATSGCHSPLPHTKSDKAPAFANFHTTFLACQTCHVNGQSHPTPAGWVHIETGSPQEIPAALQLANLLESGAAPAPAQTMPAARSLPAVPVELHPRLLSLLRNVTAMADADPLLQNLLTQIDTTQPGSPVWKHAIASLAAELPQHTRGEYHAKVERKGFENTPQRLKAAREQADRYLAAAADSPQRKQVHEEIHGGLLKQSVTCLACHGEEPPLLDLQALGYSARRADYLRKLEVARMMQQVRQGERFYLPRLLEGSDGR